MTPPIPTELRAFQKRSREVSALGLVLQGVDRALSGNMGLRVKVVENGRSAPAWTDGKTISLNKARVLEVFEKNDLHKAILTFKGTNYHELAHVLFTPRDGDEITAWIKKNRYQYKWAWNALEDQRIETLYTALYPPTTPYFLNSTYTWLLDDCFDQDNFYRVWSLLGGRKYVQGPVRDAARAAFAAHYGEAVTARVDEVVDEYVTLPLPGRSQRAIELVKEFHELLRGTDQSDYLEEHGCGSTDDGTAEEGEVDGEKAVEAAAREMDRQDREKAQKAKDKAQKDSQKEGEGDEDEGQGGSDSAYPEDIQDDDGGGWGDEDWDEDDQEDGSGSAGGDEDGEEGEDEQDGSGSGSGDSEDEDDEADGGADSGDDDGEDDSAGETPNDGETGNAAGENGHTEPKTADNLSEDLRDAVTDALADVLTDENLQNDIDRTVDAFKSQADGKTGDEGLAQYNNYAEVEARPESIAAVTKITTELKKLRTDMEPRWQKERLSGRLNVGGIIRNRADSTFMEIFEEWDEGSVDQATTEVVILIDLSISMDDVLPMCSEALWVLKKSFDNADIRTTVLGFSDGNTVLYKGGEKLRGVQLRQFRTWSGTDPRDSMLYAHRVLLQSDATNKVLITITDGVWTGRKDDGADPENVVRAVRQAGGTTLLFGVNGHRTTTNTHGFEQCADLTYIGDMVKIVHGLVRGIQERAATR